jgi:hypothetical protein
MACKYLRPDIAVVQNGYFPNYSSENKPSIELLLKLQMSVCLQYSLEYCVENTSFCRLDTDTDWVGSLSTRFWQIQ